MLVFPTLCFAILYKKVLLASEFIKINGYVGLWTAVIYISVSIICLLVHRRKQYLLDYSECMADTYFYGYLRQIVPSPKDKDKESMKDRLLMYKEDQELTDDKFPFMKLFILIPASGYMRSRIDELEPNRIETRVPPEPIFIDRAGVPNREYKVGIFQIYYSKCSHKHITVAMVGTPPLHALSECCPSQKDLKKNKRNLTWMFYFKLLAKIKRHNEIDEFCELIYIDTDEESLADYIVQRHLDLLGV